MKYILNVMISVIFKQDMISTHLAEKFEYYKKFTKTCFFHSLKKNDIRNEHMEWKIMAGTNLNLQNFYKNIIV